MMAFVLLFVYLGAGVFIIRFLLPRQNPLARAWLGLATGLFLMMWLPALLAFLLPFTAALQYLSLIPLAGLSLLAYLVRDNAQAAKFSEEERKTACLLLFIALPLTLLGAYLQHTHILRPQGGALYTGQATYGDLPLHLSIITSLPGKTLPMDYSILPGVRLGYPFLANSLSSSFLVLGLSLRWAVIVPGVLMMALVFSGSLILARRLCRTPAAAALAVLMIFLNGGLGFLYSLDLIGQSLGGAGNNQLQQGVWLERLSNILQGWYQTPANHAEFHQYNLRWSNIIADMLVPQRTFLAGWAFLLPCLYLLLDMMKQDRWPRRQVVVLGVLAGGLPLTHTHSFLALGMASAGFLLYDLLHKKAWKPWLAFAGIAVALALPQLLAFTFTQSSGENFLRFQFNWVNNPGGHGLRDLYLWFYVKNIGLPFLLLVFALFEKNAWQRRLFSGAFVIFIVAEFILFQPNEYDNNKLFYVWWLLCAMPAADYAITLFGKLKGLRARPVIAVMAVVVMFLTGALALTREAVSNFQMFSVDDVKLADFVKDETPEHSRFITGIQHINPVSSLAGRDIVVGPDLWLYYHGFDTWERQNDLRAFYQAPRDYADMPQKYEADYILLGPHERMLGANETELAQMYETVYEADNYRVFAVPGG